VVVVARLGCDYLGTLHFCVRFLCAQCCKRCPFRPMQCADPNPTPFPVCSFPPLHSIGALGVVACCVGHWQVTPLTKDDDDFIPTTKKEKKQRKFMYTVDLGFHGCAALSPSHSPSMCCARACAYVCVCAINITHQLVEKWEGRCGHIHRQIEPCSSCNAAWVCSCSRVVCTRPCRQNRCGETVPKRTHNPVGTARLAVQHCAPHRGACA
jgi:hypothetical protein